MNSKKLFYVFKWVTLFNLFHPLFGQLANSYPGDVGIENNPNVLYVEKFDDGMPDILSRYSDIQNSTGMQLDVDVPNGSLGPYSLKMTSIQGVNVGGHLFKYFSPGFSNTLYIRYYVKYPAISNGYFHHEGLWFGGYNPSTAWPNPQAGSCGLGSSRISIAYENVWPGNPPGMDTYLYWGDMQSWNGGSSCYGNTMITEGRTDYGYPPQTNAPLDHLDQWMCVEIMIKLNDPVTAYNGELAIWQNGIQIGHWGPGFPNGHWLKDKWYNNPNDPPFQGFRWRTDANLDINWIWFEFYHDDPNAPSSYIKFDHLVMATEYIGPIATTTAYTNTPSIPSAIRVYPNPLKDKFTLRSEFENGEIVIYNVMGESIYHSTITNLKSEIEMSNQLNGIYFLKVYNDRSIHIEKILKQ